MGNPAGFFLKDFQLAASEFESYSSFLTPFQNTIK